MKLALLGKLTAEQFLRRYWQKNPLLVRNALPGFAGLVEPAALFALAGREDVEARLVKQTRDGWQLNHGPFSMRQLAANPKRNWTLLVQDLNHFLPDAAALLARFSFIPHARVDDVMVSFAAEGGGVGPHFDSYDVFLLQGMGQRRWQISAQRDLTLKEDVSLKILANFRAEQEWILDPGDMLYLPPGHAHHGIALTPCMTYSIGFRAPSAQELTSEFLIFLQDHLHAEGAYADPDLCVQEHPAEVSDAIVAKTQRILRKVRWDRQTIGEFLGSYLSEPKPHVLFAPPQRSASFARFVADAGNSGIALALKSRMLFRGEQFYLNGEMHCADAADAVALRRLADLRVAKPFVASDSCMQRVYQWYRAGFITLSKTAKRTQREGQ
jgi:50S ribosomal protein L16 3-hydroxylase